MRKRALTIAAFVLGLALGVVGVEFALRAGPGVGSAQTLRDLQTKLRKAEGPADLEPVVSYFRDLKAQHRLVDLESVTSTVAMLESQIHARRDLPEAPRRMQLIELTDRLLPLFADQPVIQSRLLYARGGAQARDEDDAAGADSMGRSNELIIPVTSDLLLRRQRAYLAEAEAFDRLGRMEEAEKTYVRVVKYPWDRHLGPPAAMEEMRQTYRRAMLAIIRLRAGNPTLLRYTYLVGPDDPELTQALRAAREAVGPDAFPPATQPGKASP